MPMIMPPAPPSRGLVHQPAHPRMRASRPMKIASPIRKWPMLSSTHLRDGGDRRDVVVVEPVAGVAPPARGRARSAAVATIRASSAARGGRRRRDGRSRRRCAARPPARRAAPTPRSALRSASMNSETRMPAARSARDERRDRGLCWPATSSPPSVVRSSRRSGTRQAACGRMPQRDRQHLVGHRHLEVQRHARAPRPARRCRRRGCAGDPRAGAR